MKEYQAKVLGTTVTHQLGQVKWFEEIVQAPNGIALVEFETFMNMKSRKEKSSKTHIPVKWEGIYVPQKAEKSFSLRLRNWQPSFEMPKLDPYQPKKAKLEIFRLV